MATGESPLDWWAGEALAFASLLEEGTRVRVSGQDAQRGTFSHRHAILHDKETGKSTSIFDGLSPEQGEFSIFNSPLSEAAVLGFDFGYSLEWPDGLGLGQFGILPTVRSSSIIHFHVGSNGAIKWVGHVASHGRGTRAGTLVRATRAIFDLGEDNIRVANLTNPAQLFHALRRQVRSSCASRFVMTPKSLLRHPKPCPVKILVRVDFKKSSQMSVMRTHQRHYRLCSAKSITNWKALGKGLDLSQVPILRLEQVYLGKSFAGGVGRLSRRPEIRWVKGAANMGAWRYINEKFAEEISADSSWFGSVVPNRPVPRRGLSLVTNCNKHAYGNVRWIKAHWQPSRGKYVRRNFGSIRW